MALGAVLHRDYPKRTHSLVGQRRSFNFGGFDVVHQYGLVVRRTSTSATLSSLSGGRLITRKGVLQTVVCCCRTGRYKHIV